jgi:hypothetical protein
MALRARSHCHYLPRMQQQDGGGVLCCFDPVRAAATSFACNSESDVGFYCPSTLFAPPLPSSHATASRRSSLSGSCLRSSVRGWCTNGLVNSLYTLPIHILTCMFYDVSYIYLCVPPESAYLNNQSTVYVRTTEHVFADLRVSQSLRVIS